MDTIREYIENCYAQPAMQYRHLSGEGPIYLLEEKLRKFYNKKYAVAFCNATTAMQAVCLAMNLKKSEIVTTPVNWGGSIAPFLLHGNKLHFTSVDKYSLNLEVSDLPFVITPGTKVVLSVDYNGAPSDSEAIKAFSKKNGLFYISDSAQSMGAYRNGKPAGYFADALVLSFSPGKSVFAGEGGAVITDYEDLYEKLLWFSQHPAKQKTVLGITNYNEYAPLNGRMNPLSAILLNETFTSSLIKLRNKQKTCFRLLTQLQTEKLVEQTPHISSPESSTYFSFSLQMKASVTLKQVNDFLTQQKQSFCVFPSTQKMIPFDVAFRKQFRRNFSCSKNLLKQRSESQLRNRITLNYSPEKSKK
jgi:dTDP-4-amino-4,6-dideoxygalactose transaminase